ncbi:MAG: hypothetical protein K8T89_06855 [Planctomycetes bacterium]|nr:hypothetical protein [Planctomycetota bacterium]
MNPPFRNRRSLTNLGGAIETEGDAEDTAKLAEALAVRSSLDDEDAARSHVHGFHTYPARMHPDTAARLVRSFVPDGGTVLDPFCGSGTVLIEALVAEVRPFGVDLNPLAVMLTKCKTRLRSTEELQTLIATATVCANYANERRKARAGASRRYSAEDVQLFEPHVLLELDSLRTKISEITDNALWLDLALVLSSLLVKFSKKSSDTSGEMVARKTMPGFPSKMFVRKAEDLVQRLMALGKLVTNPQPVFVDQDDATKLKTLPSVKMDAIVTSPPYAATYDYVAHHMLRLRWLGLDASSLKSGELGSRSTYERVDPRKAADTWSHELARFFRAAKTVLAPGGKLVMLMADSALGTIALRAEEIVAQTARDCGLYPAARASQPRPHFHGPSRDAFRDRPRFEHAILLRN